MRLTDVSSVFSRYFVVGFFVPPFVALVTLWKTLSGTFPPDALHYSEATNVAILGAIALPIGLLLVGLHSEIAVFLTGSVLRARWLVWPLRAIAWLPGEILLWKQRYQYDRLHEQLLDARLKDYAASYLERNFPPDRALLMPTRYGNAVRAGQYYALTRWGLDTVTVWPRIEALLTERERDLYVEARTDVAFSMNSMLAAVAVTATQLADWIAYRDTAWSGSWWVAPLAVAVLFQWLLRRAAVREWGQIKSAIDLHRLDLYDKLGLRRPKSDADERALAAAVNRALAYGVALPDPYRL